MKNERRAALGIASDFQNTQGKCCTQQCNQGRACPLKPAIRPRREPRNFVERVMRMFNLF